MEEDMIDVEVNLDKETINKLNSMTKKELINRICSIAVEAKTYRLRCQTAVEDADRERRKSEELQFMLDKAETYVEQGRAMITAVMERWYEYDS